jgi:hypothetical protein
MCKKIIKCLLVALPVFLYSCEYELENTNYIELAKPENLDINIKLNAPVNDKGEYLIHYNYVKCMVENPDNYRIFSVRFTPDIPNTIYWNGSYLYFSYYGTYLSPFSVKCTLQLQPDTAESIAEISGYGYLEKEIEWKFVLDPKPAPQLDVKYEKKDSKTYRLTWEVPDPYYGEVDYYEVQTYYYYIGYSFPYYLTHEEFADIRVPDNVTGFNYYVSAYFKENYLLPLQESGSIELSY